MLATLIVNMVITVVLLALMIKKYLRDRQEGAFGWSVMFVVMIFWNISLYIRQTNLLSEKSSGFILVVISCYLGFSIVYATLMMIFGEVKRKTAMWLITGVILAPLYAAFAAELITDYLWKLLPAQVIIAGSEIACGYILLKYFKWNGKALRIKVGVVCIAICQFILAVNTFTYLFGISSGNTEQVSIALGVSAISKLFFFAGIVLALL